MDIIEDSTFNTDFFTDKLAFFNSLDMNNTVSRIVHLAELNNRLINDDDLMNHDLNVLLYIPMKDIPCHMKIEHGNEITLQKLEEVFYINILGMCLYNIYEGNINGSHRKVIQIDTISHNGYINIIIEYLRNIEGITDIYIYEPWHHAEEEDLVAELLYLGFGYDETPHNVDITGTPLGGMYCRLYMTKESHEYIENDDFRKQLLSEFNRVRLNVIRSLGADDYRLRLSLGFYNVIRKALDGCNPLYGNLRFVNQGTNTEDQRLVLVEAGDVVLLSDCSQNPTSIHQGDDSSFLMNGKYTMFNRGVYIDWPSADQIISLLTSDKRSIFVFSYEGLWVVTLDHDFFINTVNGWGDYRDHIIDKIYKFLIRVDDLKYVRNNPTRNSIYINNITHLGSQQIPIANPNFDIGYPSRYKEKMKSHYVKLLNYMTVEQVLSSTIESEQDQLIIADIKGRYTHLFKSHIIEVYMYTWEEIGEPESYNPNVETLSFGVTGVI